MRIGFIGAGRVGQSMGSFWLSKGEKVLGYYSRSVRSAEKAAENTNTRAFPTPASLAAAVDLLMITTPDDAIQTVGDSLASLALNWENKIVSHMSGVYSSDLLLCLFDKGATVCSLHPMMSFGNTPSSVQALDHSFFTLEGKGSKLGEFEKFLERQGIHYQSITADRKALYHAAACILSNYFVTLVDTGIQMMRSTGFPESMILDCIQPLIEKTWENILAEGTGTALTGPISRGDIGTIRLHRQSLCEAGRPGWLEVYEVMGKRTVELALQAARIDAETAINLSKELGQ